MRAVALVVGLSFAGAAPAAGQQEWTQGNLVAQAKRLLDDRLVDYPSARFRDVRIAADAKYLCGAVNSKTQMGGYGGWHRFFVQIEEPEPRLALTNDEVVAPAMERECGSHEREWIPGDHASALKSHAD